MAVKQSLTLNEAFRGMVAVVYLSLLAAILVMLAGGWARVMVEAWSLDWGVFS